MTEPAPSPYILSLPKAELHLHLEGTVEPRTLVELSRIHDASVSTGPLDEEAVRALYQYKDFAGFLMAFKAVTERLQTPDDYELITYQMMERLRRDNVLHAEVYYSAGISFWRGHDVDAIFAAIERGRERGQRNFGVSVLWIFDAVRNFGAEAAMRVVEKAAQLRDRNANVVGFGIGGDERNFPPEMFRQVYQTAKQRGLRLTAHAGESAGPESVWGALNLGAERIGHGLTAIQDRELMAVLVERQVPIEMCITSNLRTGCCYAMKDHPVRKMFDLGAMMTLNSDDPAMFGSSLAQEYAIAQQHFDFSDEHLRELARNSFEASFLPADSKVKFLDQIDAVVVSRRS